MGIQEKIQEKIEINLPRWLNDCSKGDFGKIMIIGGSPQYYGAPIISALAAENAGADLITLFLPEIHKESAKNYSLNLFLNTFHYDEIGIYDVKKIHEKMESCHVMLIGNGIGYNADVQKAVLSILSKASIPIVLDAEALFPSILEINPKNRTKWIITPHKGEFKRLFNLEPTKENVIECASKYEITICLKGPIDYIADSKNFYENFTGVPQMRVGGTGDALAGIIATYYSMGLTPFEATKTATFLWGKCGEDILENLFSLTAYKMIKHYPKFLAKTIKKHQKTILLNTIESETKNNQLIN